MNALVHAAEAEFEAMSEARLEAVMDIETRAYEFPWSRGNFSDSLRAGYQAQLLVAEGAVLGYFVAMKGLDEVHLLNLTVDPALQGRGWGRVMLEALATWARGKGAEWLWLEVRVSNLPAQRLYEHVGFRTVGRRPAYYPAAAGQREDAIVMSLKL
ncbi:ribosomal protein S18-alanine N-acetyltransferase [Ramlibacter rhizophilus]|uniref:[Ribosomal protein bS18]-alanine N-acetyltransferase n=1 Tax=Ramlibacter rhizophilus TaxID=1781167 RepID=A0A4Z0BGE5_9BURK|nr:ribosomal protein S18-alanine N-acetyltransferase [Ramlibacter rhizophilus]TFY97850.1 ribosomal-protein-alanine N-acetyltransferase [Ramlibacter rhizophilus]